jgi:hypothetical protein
LRKKPSQYFSKLGYEVARIKKQLDEDKYTFSLTDSQFKGHKEKFEKKMNAIRMFEGQNAGAAVIRLGVIAFRLAMILTVLRRKDELKKNTALECSDEDFDAVIDLIDVYFEHSMVMYSLLPRQSKAELSSKVRQFYELLPADEKFPRKKAVEVGTAIGICERTVGNYLDKLTEKSLIINPEYGIYMKNELD